MSALVRNVIRTTARPTRQIRFNSSAQPSSTYFAERNAVEHHAQETTDLWRKISWFVCIPAIATCVAWVYNVETEHRQHMDHLRAGNDGHPPEVPAYEYMNRRSKPYPWGVNSLFFNPKANKNLEE